MSQTSWPSVDSEFPDCAGTWQFARHGQRTSLTFHSCARARPIGVAQRCARLRGPPVHRPADRAAGDVRGPGRDRHRERPAVRGAGAAQPPSYQSEALEQQTATAEVLRVIASSPTDLQRVLEAIVETCRAALRRPSGAVIDLVDGDGHASAAHGRIRRPPRPTWRLHRAPLGDDGDVAGRAILERRTDPRRTTSPISRGIRVPGPADSRRVGNRHRAAVPLLRDGAAIGTLRRRPGRSSRRSPSGRSRCWRRSPTRPSSRSRTPGCSRSWSSATRTEPEVPRRWSSRPRRPRCCGSSRRRRPISSGCWTTSSRRPPASARPREATIWRRRRRSDSTCRRGWPASRRSVDCEHRSVSSAEHSATSMPDADVPRRWRADQRRTHATYVSTRESTSMIASMPNDFRRVGLRSFHGRRSRVVPTAQRR